MSIGDSIRALRKRAGMSQRELAEKCGMRQNSINNYENGNRIPRIDYLEKIAFALGVTVKELLGFDAFGTEQDGEFRFLLHYAKEAFFDEEICRDLLRALWTAYCLHKNLDASSAKYASELLKVWFEIVEGSGGDTADWSDFRSFDTFMQRYLV